jgi:hypothetical protein
VDGDAIPALRFTVGWARHNSRSPSPVLPSTALWLGGVSHVLVQEEIAKSERERKDQEGLLAAALRDLAGKTQSDLEEANPEDHPRTIERAVARGRDLCVKLGAWPWWPLEEGWADFKDGKWEFRRGVPANWHECPRVVATFEAWATGSQAALHAYDARHLALGS